MTINVQDTGFMLEESLMEMPTDALFPLVRLSLHRPHLTCPDASIDTLNDIFYDVCMHVVSERGLWDAFTQYETDTREG